jgi:hypothetical protein
MSKSTRRLLAVSILCVFISATGSAFAAASLQKIAGIWEFAGEPDASCEAPPFVNLTTISNDGTMINLDPTEGASAGRVRLMPNGSYTAHFLGYIANTGGLKFEVVGSLSLVDRDALAGTYVVDLSDPGGALICSWGGTITGTRLN